MHGALVVQRENSGGGADTGSSKCIDDAGHNLFFSGEAARGGNPPAQREVVIVVSGSQASADQALVMMSVILPSLDAPHGLLSQREKTALSGPQSRAAARKKEQANRPSIELPKSLYSAGL